MQFKYIEGQRVLINRLTEIIDSGRVSHAQLFLGENVSGSLQLAIAYAQYLNCQNRQHFQGADPSRDIVADSCGVCPNCQKYRQLSHPDLHLFFPNTTTTSVKSSPSCAQFQQEFRDFLEKYGQRGTLDDWYDFMDVANKQGLIRDADGDDIVKVVGLKSYEAGTKIIVIWMAEKMNPTVANKLLKSLEEPTGDTLFLLVAESSERLLSTIISRTQEVRVPSLSSRGDVQLSAETRERFAALYVGWMRMLFKLDMKQLAKWVDDISTIGREQQKLFLLFAQTSLRQCFLCSQAGLPMTIGFGDPKFDASFPQFVTARNIEGLNKAFDDTLYAIERNAYAKIAFMELSFSISKWLKKR